MKKLLFLSLFLLPFVVSAAPTAQNFTNIQPFVDQTYNNGSTSLAWLGTFTKNLTLSTTTIGCAAVGANGSLYSIGSPCGSGSGTVGSGTQGQFPFYNSSGTTLTATSSLFVDQAGNILVNWNGNTIFGDLANFTVYGSKPYTNQGGEIETCTSTSFNAKCLYSGYDDSNGFAYIQSLFKTIGYMPLILNPNGGRVSVGTSPGAVPNSDFQVDRGSGGIGGGNVFGTNTTIWMGSADGTVGNLNQLGFGSHTGFIVVPTAVFTGQQVAQDATDHLPVDFVWAQRLDGSAYNSTPVETMRLSNQGILMVGTTTMGYGTSIAAAQTIFASTTAPQLSLASGSSISTFRVENDGRLVYATSSPLTGATSTPIFSIDANGVPTYLNSGVVKLSSGTVTVTHVFIDAKTIIQHDTQSACLGSVDVTATTSTSFTLTSQNLADTCLVGWNLLKHN